MDDQNKNLILATALSFLVILAWFLLFPPPEPEAPVAERPSSTQTAPSDLATAPSAIGAPEAGTAPADTPTEAAEAPRVGIDTPRVAGSISLLYALYGWAPGAGLTLDDVPGANTTWQAADGADTLTPRQPRHAGLGQRPWDALRAPRSPSTKTTCSPSPSR
jgi:YidC/Oxa1 family membrane protein insertase